MKIIPLAAVPSQSMNVVLGGQNCSLNVYQKIQGIYVDVYLSGAAVATTVLALDRNRIVRKDDGTFIGDLAFFDTQGVTDPVYNEFGTRYKLAYLEPQDELY
jgi:hypothetical protein